MRILRIPLTRLYYKNLVLAGMADLGKKNNKYITKYSQLLLFKKYVSDTLYDKKNSLNKIKYIYINISYT